MENFKNYTIVKKPEVLDWTQIPAVDICHHLESPAVNISASAQLCYDENALYVKLSAKEANIRAEYTGLLDAPCEDSCLEFFFSPIPGDNRYLNIEYNPNCCLYLGVASCPNDLIRLIPEAGRPFTPEVTRNAYGWEITYHIPHEFVKRLFSTYAPISGNTIRGNFYKCGDLTVQEHYLCWNMITGDEISFHRPCDFGYLTFE